MMTFLPISPGAADRRPRRWARQLIAGICALVLAGCPIDDRDITASEPDAANVDAGHDARTDAPPADAKGNPDGEAGATSEAGTGCTAGTQRACSNALGNCARGHETCGMNGTYGACDVAPKSADACDVPGDDATCNGVPNEGCPCVENSSEPCGPDAPKGACMRGTATCTNQKWGQCVGAVGPAPRNCDSSQDNDCDGNPDNTVDTVCKCVVGSVRSCGMHPNMDGNGPCHAGTQMCVPSADKTSSDWGPCQDSVGPAPRDCGSALDNDCDGTPDNTVDTVCKCAPGSTQKCQTHPANDGKGPCQAGTQTCVAGAGKTTSDWGMCSGSVGPASADSCTVKGDDSNCNGTPNDGCPCVEGDTQPCGPDNPQGLCKKGTAHCTNQKWGGCDAIFPAPRDCTSASDNDCDGKPDNTVDTVCQCAVGTSRGCGTHPGLDGNGPCKAGSQACVASADKMTSSWSSSCTGSVGPSPRNCTSATDNDCDGKPDNTADSICQCSSSTATRACETHPQDGVGICKAGSQTCIISVDKTTASFGACSGSVGPGSRNCTSAADNDCDGKADNTIDTVCQCASGSRACNTHPGKDGKGPCKAGSQSCQIAPDFKTSVWSACSGDVGPAASDTCDPGNDANCSGTANDGCACVNGTTRHCGNCGTQSCASGAWGATCSTQCQQPNSNCSAAYTCTCLATQLCSTCPDWDFEDGTLGSWGITFNPTPITGSISVATGQNNSPTGSHSMMLSYSGMFTDGLQEQVWMRTPFCAAGAGLMGQNIHFWVKLVSTTGATNVTARANPLGWSNDPTMTSPTYDPDVDQVLTEGVWTEVKGFGFNGDFNLYSYVGLYIDVRVTGGPWQGVLYIDDYRIAP
jgi:hypothetical protein